jgi:predicted DNA-binding protein with PD1-like motif
VQVFEVRDDELMGAIAEQAGAAGIRNGAIVSLIGAVDAFTISTMPAVDASADVLTEYVLPAEMSGTGENVDGVVHIHAVMAVDGDRAISGHLHRAEVKTHFARAYVLPQA